jgi:hypothetical protein
MKISILVVSLPTNVGSMTSWRIPDFVDQERN